MTQAQTGNFTWFSKAFSQTHTGIDNSGSLSFWLYVSDASKLEGGQIEITSSGKPDTDEYSWLVGSLNLSNGWNELHLQISSTAKMGNPDLDTIFTGVSRQV